MKGLFKPKVKSPVELVQHMRDLLIFLDRNTDTRGRKREEKLNELGKALLEVRVVLFGNGQTEPSNDACAQLTLEFFRVDTFHLLIVCMPKLDLGARQNATHSIANLQRQRVGGKLIAAEYIEKNVDLLDILLNGYLDDDIALTYGAISREVLRHQTVARYILESEHMRAFFDYIQNPNFDIASDAQATFKELLTRHKSTVAEYFSKNYDWFFEEFTPLLESTNYITRRYAVKLLGDILLDRTNSAIMARYVSSLDNMRIVMNLFRDSKKAVQIETFHVFKLFVANQFKPPEIISVLVTNRDKLLRFLNSLTTEKEDEQLEADKAQVIKEITELEIPDRTSADSEVSEVEDRL